MGSPSGGLHGSPPAVDAQELALCETLVMDGCIQTGEVLIRAP